jgi:hypothetical protein
LNAPLLQSSIVSHRRPMNLKTIIAISLVSAIPECAQAQSPSVPRVTKDDAQKVVTIIGGDQAKTQTYCEIQNIGEQMERAYEKRNLKLSMNCCRKLKRWKKLLVPNMSN